MIRGERIFLHHNAVPRARRRLARNAPQTGARHGFPAQFAGNSLSVPSLPDRMRPIHCNTVKVAAPGLEAEPTVITRGCEPKGAFGGTVKLI